MAAGSFLTATDMASLENKGRINRYKAQDVIIQHGAINSPVCWVRRGSVHIELTAPYHGIVYRDVGPGEIVGEISFLDEGASSAKVTANEDVEILEIDRPELTALMTSDPNLTARFYQTLATTLARRLRAEDVSLVLDY